MLEAIRDVDEETGRRVGMKPAGGIRQAKQAVQYLVQLHETLGPGVADARPAIGWCLDALERRSDADPEGEDGPLPEPGLLHQLTDLHETGTRPCGPHG